QEQQGYTLLNLQAQRSQGISRTVDLVQDVLIGDLLLTIEERRLGTTPSSDIDVHIGSGNVQHVRQCQLIHGAVLAYSCERSIPRTRASSSAIRASAARRAASAACTWVSDSCRACSASR